MTNEEIDRKCCEFTGIPGRYYTGAIPVYPPVSTSWEAAGRLMDALVAKDMHPWLYYNKLMLKWVGSVDGYGYAGVSEKGPMALALAVVALADSTKALSKA